MGKVDEYVRGRIISGEKLHFTLIDPDKSRNLDKLEKTAEEVKGYGTDLFLIGGSLGVTPEEADNTAKVLKRTGLPVVVFPGNVNCLTKYADAVLYMILMNSLDRYYLIDAQILAAPIVRKYGLETIPIGYVVVYGDTAVAHVGKVHPLPPSKPEIIVAYAMACEMLGFKYIYLEAGSGSERIVPPVYPKLVKEHTNLVVVTGGGVRTVEQAKALIKSGADVLVTGTIVEDNPAVLAEIIKVVKGF